MGQMGVDFWLSLLANGQDGDMFCFFVSLLIATTAEICSAKSLELDASTDAFSWEG
jgi:hypothetical protein